MTTLFTRIKDAVSADLHGLMDKKEAGNPIAALNHSLRQSEKETEKVRQLVERQHRLKEEFVREYTEAAEMAEKRLQQKEVAERAGEEEYAEFAAREWEEYSRRAERLEKTRKDAEFQLEKLEHQYEDMKHRLKDMRLRQMELMGRENTARASFKMSKVTSESGEGSFSRFGEMERYIENLEQRVNRDYRKSTFDSKLAEIEQKLIEQADQATNS
ncbi:PspA/IM30 family protein [Alteribacter natronophilus]|uniref:PspA/IM30 family protein n=1 Tax=Alteribacter natronophilus TaxID=2583810 RepID=UPI00110D57A2|nr:PspA/IM30 family protein [Alteribacter natronophilus]TMW70081.1 PspA/IM30 family protein [Alteribacter natronophilus]